MSPERERVRSVEEKDDSDRAAKCHEFLTDLSNSADNGPALTWLEIYRAADCSRGPQRALGYVRTADGHPVS